MAEPPPVTLRQRMLSAMGGSLVTALVVTPLDVVKVRLQAQSSVAPVISTCCGDFVFCERHLAACEPIEARAPRLNGTMHALATILRTEGAAALWRGLSPSLLMAVPANVIYFAGYETLRNWMQRHAQFPLVAAYAPLLAGSSARAIAATAVSPIELVKTRLQSPHRSSREVLRGVYQSVAREGPLVLWQGLSPTLWRDVPFSGLYWMGYEFCKVRLRPYFAGGGAGDQFAQAFLAGFLSGATAAIVTTPFDVAKTKRQVAPAGRAGPAQSTLALLRSIHAEGGWAALFRGVTPRVLRTAPACAIMIGSYELGKVVLSAE